MINKKYNLKDRQITVQGNANANVCIIRLVNEHMIEEESAVMSENLYVTILIERWNEELSPWKNPAVFGNEDFGEGAKDTLQWILSDLMNFIEQEFGANHNRKYILAGYSLAGLFSLWAASRTDAFAAIAAVSPSVWFPGWIQYAETHLIQAEIIYLSLGDKEAKTKNQVMAKVEDAINKEYEMLEQAGRTCVLEMNPGNHFKDAGLRLQKGIQWCIDQLTCRG